MVTRIVLLGAAVAMLIIGAVIVPRPPADVDPSAILAHALRVEQPIVPCIAHEIVKAQRERCTPILEGSDKIGGRDTWAIRLKPPHRKYPWLEVWVQKRTGRVLGAKEWGKRDGRVVTLRQLPES